MKKSLIIAGLLVLVLTVGIITGCPNGTPVGQQAGNGNEGATPEPPQEVIRWTMQTSWPQGILLHEMAEYWAEEVKKASGGRLLIDVQPAGAIVPALEVLDATHAGTLDVYHSWGGYWMGRAPAAPFFASTPMSLEPLMYLVWLYEAGGWELWQEMYDNANLNVKVFPGGITHPELLAHSHVPLQNVSDWQGLKYRTPGWWGEILKDMGVAVVTMPGAELYTSLERKVIDALEFSSPVVNRQLAFNEIAEYYTGPGMHQPACLFEITINKDSYEALPDDLKAIVDMAARSMTLWSWAKDIKGGIDTLKEWEAAGNKAVSVSPEAQREFREMSWAYLDAEVAGDPFMSKVWESMKDFWYEFIEYERFMVPVRE